MKKLTQFWQELKRRNVVRRNTVYAATAFVILEVVSIVQDPLKLPEWTLTLVIVLLIIGFIVSITLSWIYDINPEGGLEKTKPVHKVKNEDKPAASNSWKIASYISFVVIITLIVLNIIPRTNRSEIKEILDKSIAVLPFTSLSDDPEKQYLADGTMDAILLHLSKIEDLRVMARTSVQQYRETDKTATEICQELNVAYLLEGSFQKYGDQAKLIVQLIQPGMEGHIWANEYDREWKDIFAVQSEVAQLVAKELQAVITPDEQQLIEKRPTTNLTAYDFYQRGMEEHDMYLLYNDNRDALERSEDFFHEALEYDSTFAQAYTGLAWVYWHKHRWEDFLSEDFLDSMLILANIALSIDDQLAEAYVVRGQYYQDHNEKEQAIKEYDKSIKFNPNEWMAYWYKGWLYFNEDLVQTIDNLHIAASLNRGAELPSILRILWNAYADAGFIEKSNYYLHEALKLDFDSVEYYRYLGSSENDLEKSIIFYKKGYAKDSNDYLILHHLGEHYMFLGQYEEALKYVKRKYEKTRGKSGSSSLGFLFWQIGYKEKAEYYFNEAINYCSRMIELGRGSWEAAYAHYTLAGVYAVRGEKDKAYENLRMFNQRQMMPSWMTPIMKDDPLFESIRDEPEFQKILSDVEAKYQAEHKRVRQWLEENDMM